MRIVVCGGRDYSDRMKVFAVLSEYRRDNDRLIIIQGGASGADAIARDWSYLQPSVRLITESADWKTHGKAAGFIRNQFMLDRYKPDLVLAFPGGRGTADMVGRARKAGVPVRQITIEEKA